MIRVLHVIPSLGRGGAERQLVNVVSQTDRSRFEHVVCYLGRDDALAEEIRRAGQKVVGLNLAADRPWLSGSARLVPLLRSIRPDIIHSWLYDGGICARLAGLVVRGLPMVVSLQNPDYEPETLKWSGWPLATMKALLWVDRISSSWSRPFYVACSDFVKQSAIAHQAIPPSRVRVIFNCVDPMTVACDPSERTRLRTSLNIPGDAMVFLNVGRLDPQKGQTFLVDAFRRLLSVSPSVYLVIAGEGPLGPTLRAFSEDAGVTERVRFIGRRSDIGACLEMSDIFVFPSLFEGFGIALVEAMAKQLPCIASRIAPLCEVLGDGDPAVLVTPGRVDELATAMARLCNDPNLRAKLGSENQRRALSQFHPRVTVGHWEDLYREVAR
jgi:glycosyltransferase involved in cell wall biosynthesis